MLNSHFSWNPRDLDSLYPRLFVLTSIVGHIRRIFPLVDPMSKLSIWGIFREVLLCKGCLPAACLAFLRQEKSKDVAVSMSIESVGLCHSNLSPITRPYSLWNITLATKLHVNDKIPAFGQTKMYPVRYFRKILRDDIERKLKNY